MGVFVDAWYVATGLVSAGLWNGIQHGNWKKGTRQICVASLIETAAYGHIRGAFFPFITNRVLPSLSAGFLGAAIRSGSWSSLTAGIGSLSAHFFFAEESTCDRFILVFLLLCGLGLGSTYTGDYVWNKANRVIEQLPSRRERV